MKRLSTTLWKRRLRCSASNLRTIARLSREDSDTGVSAWIGFQPLPAQLLTWAWMVVLPLCGAYVQIRPWIVELSRAGSMVEGEDVLRLFLLVLLIPALWMLGLAYRLTRTQLERAAS